MGRIRIFEFPGDEFERGSSLIKLSRFQKVNGDFEISAEVSHKALFRERAVTIIIMATQMIASRLADMFIKEHGQELLKRIDKEAVTMAIMKTSQFQDEKKLQEAIFSGRCLGCSRQVRDWKAPNGSFAPEEWATLEENGIDPTTGHRKDCKYAQSCLFCYEI